MMEQALSLADFDDFSARLPASVSYGFFGRKGGVSAGIYESLNCGAGSDDDPGLVAENRAIVARHIGCVPERLLSLYQVHGAVCLTVREPWAAGERPEADAFVTDVPGIGLGILTADCTPVLFCGRKADGAPVIGAAHAGWGGALKGVLGATVEKLLALGAVRESLCACIGPCIAQASYEVREDFTGPFLEQDEENERFFKAGRRSGHLMFDLPGYCALRLYKAGVAQVFMKDLDTYALEADFFSYRRATHREEPSYGRQISAVMISTVAF